MKNLIIFCLVFLAVVSVAWAAQDSALSIRQVRDPVQLRDKLNANALDTETRVAAVEATSAGGALAAGKVLVGDATGAAAAVNLSGDVTVITNGTVTIAANAIGNAEIVATAAIAHTKLAPVLPTYILVGDANSNAVAVAVSGAATIAANGAVTTVGVTTNLAYSGTNIMQIVQGRIIAINP
jgi:hypothetical protein